MARKRLWAWVITLAMVAVVGWAWVGSHRLAMAPANAKVLGEPDHHKYASPPCVEQGTLEQTGDYLIEMTKSEALAKGFRADHGCANANGFTEQLGFGKRPTRWSADGAWRW